jgi:hypothetical protein
MGAGAHAEGGAPDVVWARLSLLLEVAAYRGDALSMEDALNLLPEPAPSTPDGLLQWSNAYPDRIRMVGDSLVPSHAVGDLSEREERANRANHFMKCARQLLSGPLAPVRSLALVVAVTGSVAYRSARAGDDLDLLLVLRRGCLSFFLAWSYAAIRIHRLRGGRTDPLPPICMNLVLEEPQARQEFSMPAGLLIAREALSAVVIQGPEEYRSLLREASWMRELLPRLYQRTIGTADPGSSSPAGPAPLLIRLISALLFLPLGAYLQGVGLWRNHRLRLRLGEPLTFRTVFGPGHLKFTSLVFDRLKRVYEGRARSDA